jgi:asparagine synthase (glutamine-hydrolysing)
MCGIAGVFRLRQRLQPDDVADVRAMSGLLRHRGPDGGETRHDERAALAANRLRVVDLSSAANQPMVNEDGSVWLAYNGAITNFQELERRFDLRAKFKFRSRCDTEVALRLFEEQGLGMLEHLSGMFAFCVYDRRARKAYLVRDPFGQRPLFYTVLDGALYFASELKAFHALPGFRPAVDAQAAYHYFTLAYVPGPQTIYQGVHELEGGRLVEIDLAAGTHEERAYYQLRYAPDDAMSEDDAASRARALMSDALRRNLVTDARAGLAFSGGLDTSALLALSREQGRPLPTFSVRIDEPSFDESRYQRLMLDGARGEHHEVVVRARDVLREARGHMAFMDEPLGDGASIPLFLLARAAKPHVSVLLSGEGGDEIFSAYETHRAFKARKLWREFAPAPLRRAARWAAQKLPTSHSKLSLDFVCKRFTAGAELGIPESHVYWRHAVDLPDQKALMPGFEPAQETAGIFTRDFERLGFEQELDRLSHLDLRYYFVGDLMLKNDRMLMAHSIEGRYPYMDRPLVEFAATIPPRLRLKGLTGGRHIQKRAVKDLLPAAILRRSNMGLELPYSRWLLTDLRAEADRLFSSQSVGRSGLLEPAAVRRLWEEHAAMRRDNGRALWSILMFLIWFELFMDKKDFRAHLAAP